MNTLKKTLALVAALAMTATAFVGCGDEESSSPSSSSESSSESTPAEDETSPAEGDDSSSEGGDDATEGQIDASVGTGGSTFTVAAWNPDDVPYLIAQWKGLDYKTVAEDLANDKVDGIKFISFGVGGGDASERYDQIFSSDDDLDVYFCEADWALNYINDDEKTLDLAKLGLTDSTWPNIYSYTDDIGKSESGIRKGISWQAAAGGFAYRADLAEEYLGVKSPEEMQEQVADWDKFVAAATTVSEKSNKSVALADSLGGLWQAFACSRTTPWVKDNVVQIDDFCQKFADTAKALWDINGVTQNGQWTDEWTASGVNGNVMGYFVSTWGFGGFFLDAAGGAPDAEAGKEAGAQYGKWALCQGPTPYYWGGTWIVVNPKTDNGEEARDFIISATADEAQMKEYAVNKPEYVNNSAVMDELIAADTVFNESITGNFKDNQNIYATLADNAKSINFNGLITPYDATCKTKFIDAVKETYVTGGSWDDTVNAFKDKGAEALPDLNWD